tara:strand:- start:1116 stop:1289 length:174 start_codon:yes stop_codon:yes gene_type:complete
MGLENIKYWLIKNCLLALDKVSYGTVEINAIFCSLIYLNFGFIYCIKKTMVKKEFAA